MLILRNRNILLIWLGQVLSQVGTRMYQLALAWWILSHGGSGRQMGLFMMMGALPALLLVKVIGKTVDRLPSRPLLVACDGLSCAVVLAAAWMLQSSQMTLGWLYLAGFLVAGSQAFFDPALNKAVAAAAAAEDMEEAVAFQTSTQSLASFSGAAAGALLIAKIGIPAVVAFNALSFLVSGVCNAMLTLKPATPQSKADAAEEPPDGDFFKQTPWLKKGLLGFGCANFFLTPILVILPLYAKLTLNGGVSLLGALEASLWLGLTAGTFASKWLDFSRNTLKLGAGALAVAGASLFLPGLVANRALFAALLFSAGAALGVNNVKFVALFQETVAPEHKGRFFALMQALLAFTFPVAFLLFGLLADRLSPQRVCLVQGLGVMGLAVYFLKLSDDFGEAELTPAAPETA